MKGGKLLIILWEARGIKGGDAAGRSQVTRSPPDPWTNELLNLWNPHIPLDPLIPWHPAHVLTPWPSDHLTPWSLNPEALTPLYKTPDHLWSLDILTHHLTPCDPLTPDPWTHERLDPWPPELAWAGLGTAPMLKCPILFFIFVKYLLELLIIVRKQHTIACVFDAKFLYILQMCHRVVRKRTQTSWAHNARYSKNKILYLKNKTRRVTAYDTIY